MTGTAGAAGPSRRAVLAAGGLLPLAPWAPALLRQAAARAGAGAGLRFLDRHQAAVLDAAAARLVPGPRDDPAEAGHPGAREADVVRYLDTLLSAFDDDPPRVFAGGPWSDRHVPGGVDHMAEFVPLEEAQRLAWRRRVRALREQFAAAVRTLDAAAGGDFTAVPAARQDEILTSQDAVRQLLFAHTVEGLYSVPEYAGNAGTSAWREISWPGDAQPVGYTAAEVSRDDGPDPVALADLPAVRLVLDNLDVAARALLARGRVRG